MSLIISYWSNGVYFIFPVLIRIIYAFYYIHYIYTLAFIYSYTLNKYIHIFQSVVNQLSLRSAVKSSFGILLQNIQEGGREGGWVTVELFQVSAGGGTWMTSPSWGADDVVQVAQPLWDILLIL